MDVVFAYGILAVFAIVMWFPGFLLARNMVRAVAQREPTSGETFRACIPILNISVARTQLYGSAKIVTVPLVLAIIATIVRYLSYFLFPEAIVFGLISLIILWITYAVVWLLCGYVLWDMGTCIQAGLVTKLMSFIIPPVAQWAIGRDCQALMSKAFADMEKASKQEAVNGNYNTGR